MTTPIMKHQKVFLASIVALSIAFFISTPAMARIPEPDCIIYGIAGDDAIVVTLKVSGQEIAAYTMGDNPDAGEFYILRVPMDALEPFEPGTARVGDKAHIFVNDDTQPIAAITLGERGGIRRLDFVIADEDTDGIPDGWEQQIVFGDPHDNIVSVGDVSPWDDFDKDRFSNLREYLSGSDPVYATDIPICWSDVYTDGDVDGEDLSIFIEDLYYNDCPCTFDLDGDGDVDEIDLVFFSEDYSRIDCND